jgi:hypothetical protein
MIGVRPISSEQSRRETICPAEPIKVHGSGSERVNEGVKPSEKQDWHRGNVALFVLP